MLKYTESFHTDIKENSKFEKYLPNRLIPYSRLARLDRPIGSWLLLFPCLWSLWLAADSSPSWLYVFLYILGAFIMRGAGCTYNDLIDCDLDQKVERTSFRPIPSGHVSKRNAILFLILQLSLGFIILIQLPGLTIGLGCLSLFLVFIYPWLKRITYWPQLFLGFTFNWGALMGWSTAQETLSLPAICLYIAGIFWALLYDTIYAHQDQEDDLLIGVRSTALKFSHHPKRWLFLFAFLSFLFFLSVGWLLSLNWIFYGGVGGVGLHFCWQILTLQTTSPENCLAKFKSNQWVGWILLLAIIGARMMTIPYKRGFWGLLGGYGLFLFIFSSLTLKSFLLFALGGNSLVD